MRVPATQQAHGFLRFQGASWTHAFARNIRFVVGITSFPWTAAHLPGGWA
jgi:hypothetical protein